MARLWMMASAARPDAEAGISRRQEASWSPCSRRCGQPRTSTGDGGEEVAHEEGAERHRIGRVHQPHAESP